jgi:vanillate O-demethylase monooxygenase subunit
MARLWHPVLVSSRLVEGPVAAELLGRPLALWRVGGRAVCFDDICRHLGASLSLGTVTEGRLRCAYHGWTYDPAGRCVDIPARRGAPIPRDARVRSYAVEERYGLVWVCLDEPTGAVPAFPEAADPAYRLTAPREYPAWRASAPRIVMGALDDTHFPWVHPGILGDPAHPEPPDHHAELEGDALVAWYETDQPAREFGAHAATEQVAYRNWATPSTIRLRKRSAVGTYVIFYAICPVAHDRSLVVLLTARDFDTDPAHDERYLSFEDGIQEQDRPVVESQRPWLLPPLSSRLSLYVRPADLPLIAYQRWLEGLGIPVT